MTLHAGDNVTGISRLASLHGGSNAFRVLADALRILVHLNLHYHPPIGPGQTARRVLSVEPLLVNNESVQATIREGALHMLRNEIERQRRVSWLKDRNGNGRVTIIPGVHCRSPSWNLSAQSQPSRDEPKPNDHQWRKRSAGRHVSTVPRGCPLPMHWLIQVGRGRVCDLAQ